MKKHFFVLLLSSVFFFAGANGAFATSYGLSGWSWSADDNSGQGFGVQIPQGLGWTLFSSVTGHLTTPFGVYVDGNTGELSGYAWNSNVGWLTFNTSDLVKCNTNPGDSCPPGSGANPHAHVDMQISSAGVVTGSGKVDGWARFCGVFVSGCSGALLPNSSLGGWDGWVSLNGANYGWKYDTATKKFTGYAWAGGVDASGNAGFGWMSAADMAIDITPPPVYGLTFRADTYTVLSVGSTTLRWSTKGVNSCMATGDWSGAKSAADGTYSQSTGAILASKTYNLECFTSGGSSTGVQTVTVSTVAAVTPEDGVCGSANGVATHSKPSKNLCGKGSLTTPPGVFQNGNNWNWTCDGINGGNKSPTCSSTIRKITFQEI